MFQNPKSTIDQSERTFAFIDNGYFSKYFQEILASYAPSASNLRINWLALKSAFKANKVYFYDCSLKGKLDGIPAGQVTKDMLDEHTGKTCLQEALFNQIEELPGFHLRYGELKRTSRGRRNKEEVTQKMVDVQLAVDMLSFAFNGACKRFLIFAGDADFVPAIEALTNIGYWATIVGFKGHTSPSLVQSADQRIMLDAENIFKHNLLGEPELALWRPPQRASWDEGGEDSIGWVLQWGDPDGPNIALKRDFEGELWHRAVVSGDEEYGTLFGYSHTRWETLLCWLRYKYPETDWPDSVS